MANTPVTVVVKPTLADYLATRIRSDEEFLTERQSSLGAEHKKESAAWQYLQGKRDMCKQVLLYLEEIQENPRVAMQPVVPEMPAPTGKGATKLFQYPQDYDTNE